MADEAEEESTKLVTTAGAGEGGGGEVSQKMASLPVEPAGHEGFVQPSSYLRRPRGQSRAMPPPPPKLEIAVDRDQRRGLVNALHSASGALAEADMAPYGVAKYSSLLEGPHQLRCSSFELPLNRLRYQSSCEEEPSDSESKWYARTTWYGRK